MSTTVAGLSVSEGGMIVFNVGDSRAYRVAASLQQVSVDDCVLDDRGETTWKLTACLGELDRAPEPHVASFPVDGMFLLCTDGIHAAIGAEGMRALCQENRDGAKELVRALVEAAIEAGTDDNFAIAVVEARA